MELGVRDWMIIVGILLILAVLLDGFRRVRNERRNKIRMSLNKQFLNGGGNENEVPTSELPNGGARVVRRTGGERREPEVGDLDELELNQSVPLLMESVVSANMAGELAGDEDDQVSDDLFSRVEPRHAAELEEAGPEEDGHEAVESDPEPVSRETRSRPAPGQPQEIFVINVVAREKPFNGPDLLHILLACDLRFGKMDIFHRHEQANGRGQVQFSVANSIEPGTFDLDKIDDFATTGVCFFMSVPGPEDPITAFECMVETAQCLVKNLDGEMRDESRSVMTSQTLEHCRQRLQEFERRQLAQA